MDQGDEPDALAPVGKGIVSLLTGGLSDVVKRRAGDALSNVIGSRFPKTMAKAQDAKDERSTKSVIRKALAEAAAERVAANPEIVDRTIARFLEEEFQKQERREAISEKAVLLLADQTGPSPSEEEAEVDPDWINLFKSHAERASTEALQDMWARVLSGEIRKPGSISLRTLHFVSLLDKETAEAATRLLPWLTVNVGLLGFATDAVTIADRLILRDAALIGSLDPDLNNTANIAAGAHWSILFKNRAIVFHASHQTPVVIPAISHSRVFGELADVVVTPDDPQVVRSAVEFGKTITGLVQIDVGPYFTIGGTMQQPHHLLTERWSRTAGDWVRSI